MDIRRSLARLLFPGLDHELTRARLAWEEANIALTQAQLGVAGLTDTWAQTDDTTGITGRDLDWQTRQQNLADVLTAWSINPFARRIVNLHTSHVVGRRLTISSHDPRVAAWIKRWWFHPKNQLQLEIYEWADELCRAGELFIALFPNPADGMQYVRAIPADRIEIIESDENDYRRELRYGEVLPSGATKRKWWYAADHPRRRDDPTKPIVVHYAINRPVGAVRSWGGDLEPMLPWLRRYTGWLKDRVRVNANRNAWVWKIQAANEARVSELQERYRGGILPGSVWVGMPTEDIDTAHSRIDAREAKDDGRALRQVIALAGNVPPHMIGDTEAATRATAREANAPTLQWWTMRQILFTAWLKDLAVTCVTRAHRAGKFLRWLPADLTDSLTYEVSDLTREDNLALAQAARTIVQALAIMRDSGWVTDEAAIQWAAKFAGEQLDPASILHQLENPPTPDEALAQHHEAEAIALSSWLASR